MTDKPRTFEDKLAQWLHRQISAACNDKWKEGDRCSDCEQEVTRVLMPIIANARDSEIAAKDRRIAELESEWRVREGYHQKLWNAENDKNHLLQAQIDRVRALAERYITREEHNNIIHMNETVHKRDVAERIREALQEVAPIVEFYLKREIESPSNHQEFAREAQEKLNRFRAAARTPEAK